MQKDDKGDLHPCGYISSTLTPAEQNYQVYDRELLGIVKALKEWRIYLEGAIHKVTVYTNHNNLRYFRTQQDLNARQAQWSLFLSRFPLKLVYKPGKTMMISDALSRRADSDDQKVKNRVQTLLPPSIFVRLLETEFSKILSTIDRRNYDPEPLKRLNELLQDETIDDPEWKLSWLGKQPLLFYKGKRYVPNEPNLR